MKVYIEEVEDSSVHGVTVYSLVRGMDFFYAEVRASGVTIFDREGFDSGNEMDDKNPLKPELTQAINNYLVTNK